MTVSPKRRLRGSKDLKRADKAIDRSWLVRSLRMEWLEKRELMAADVAMFQNPVIAYDVDGDYSISPLDALTVINRINQQGAGSLEGQEPEPGEGFIDVDGDNSLSPLDVLGVINFINRGEGETGTTKVAAVKYEFYRVNADGSLGDLIPDSNPATTEPDAVIGTGERVVVRTTMADLRSLLTTGTQPRGVFSAYHDMNITNADQSTNDRLQLQWSDYYRVTFDSFVTGGSVTFRWGDRTATMTPALDFGTIYPAGSLEPLRAAMNSLFGAENVRVQPVDPFVPGIEQPNADYEIHFRGSLARQDLSPNLIIESSTLTAPVGRTPITLTGASSLDPELDVIARGALNHNIDNGVVTTPAGSSPVVRYTNGPSGSLLDPSGATQTLNRVGGFANVTSPQSQSVASRFLGVVDAMFLGASQGTILLNGSITPIATGATGNNLGIALFGNAGDRAEYLTASQVVLPTGTITIVDRLSAVADTYTFQEDLGGITPPTVILNSPGVLDNDISRNESGAFVPASQVGTVITGVQVLNGGTATVVSNGSQIQFSPTTDFNGQAILQYSIRNRLGDTATGTVTINLTPVNDPPRVIGSTFATDEDIPTPGLVLTPAEVFVAGPADEIAAPNSQTVSFTSVTPTASTNGTVSLVGGNISYIPAANYFGPATFVVEAEDSAGAMTTNVTITVNVAPVNDAPLVVTSSFTVAEDAVLTVAPSQIFTPGPTNESSQTVVLSIVNAPDPLTGSASINAQGQLVVTPAANYFGPMSLRVRGTDNGTNPNNQSTETDLTITVTPVNDAPIAVDDINGARFTVLALGTAEEVNVRRNDLPGPAPENEAITVVSVTTPNIGTAVVQNGTVLFTAPTDPSVFGQTARFSYTLRDAAGLTDTADVEVLILPPASPYALDDDYRANTALQISENDLGDEFTFDVLANDYSALPATRALTADPVLVSGEGVLGRSGNLITYIPPANFFGEVVFTYQMDDSDTVDEENERRTATATINVLPVNDAPISEVRTIAGVEDTAQTITAASLNLSSGPRESDVLRFTTATMVDASTGSVTLESGNIRFTPAPDFFGDAVIRYVVTDNGTPNLPSAESFITVAVAPVNDAPIAVADSETVAEDNSLTITISNLLSNDRPGPANENSQTLSFTPVVGTVTTANGTLRQSTVNSTDVLIYTPNADFNGTDSFTYQISDGQSVNSTATGTVSIRITEVNDAPVAQTITKSVFAGVPTVFDLTPELAAMFKGAANESNQTLTITNATQGSNPLGTLVLNANGTLTYTAPLGTEGRETFSYVITDNGTTNGSADFKTAVGSFNVDVLPFIPSSFRGFVYIDDNTNGMMDANELRIGGADVTLTIAADPNVPGSTEVQRKAVTEADGSYSFDLLPPGAYTVSYVVPMMTTDAPGANSVTRTIVAPGDVNEVNNFGVLGVTARYSHILENLSSNFYLRDGELRTKGIYAAIGQDGMSQWTIARGGFEGDSFHEVVLSDDGTKAYITAVRGPNHEVYTATVSKNQFVQTVDPDTGARIVRVLARSSDLTWVRVDLSAPPATVTARKYLDAVDELFATEGW